jgi:hypothetical protein
MNEDEIGGGEHGCIMFHGGGAILRIGAGNMARL